MKNVDKWYGTPSSSEMEGSIEPENKRSINEHDRKIELATTPTAKVRDRIHIAELNESCLKLILVYLDPMDLLDISIGAGQYSRCGKSC